jgi:hypothetical protein
LELLELMELLELGTIGTIWNYIELGNIPVNVQPHIKTLDRVPSCSK